MENKGTTPYYPSEWILNHIPTKLNGFDHSQLKKLLEELPPDSEAYQGLVNLYDQLEKDRKQNQEVVMAFFQAYGPFIDECWKPRQKLVRERVRLAMRGTTREEFLSD